MTDASKLQLLFEAALRDCSDFNGRMPKPAVSPSNPAVHQPAAMIQVRAGFKPVMATVEPAHASTGIR